MPVIRKSSAQWVKPRLVSVVLVQSAAEAAVIPIDESASSGLVTQTTLSVMDAEEITAILRRRISQLHEASKSDICYATTNRQRAVAAIAPRCNAVIVVGGSNSSNSRRLVEMVWTPRSEERRVGKE